MTVTGRPWDELEDTLTFPRLQALLDQWRELPPMGDLLAGYVGFKPPAAKIDASAATGSDDPSGIGGLIAQFPAGQVTADR
jgi:hypothetical protein